MYVLNKVVWFFLNPVVVPLVVAIVGAALFKRRAKTGRILLFGSLALLWFESTLPCVCLLGLPLERPYLATQSVESLPTADAIVLLGGGIGKNDKMVYPDMFDGADRVWHAARLWKTGKAPVVVVSGVNDLEATVPLLVDFGVPREAVAVDNESRNTYENSRFTERLLLQRMEASAAQNPACGGARPRILLVTSAWHMPRACGNFSKTSLDVVPAACDFTTFNAYYGSDHWWDWIAPSADSMMRTNYLFKEWLGKFARR